jgi:hypothetical protein
MDLGADMMGHQPHDPLAIGGRERRASVGKPSDSRSIQSRPSGLSMTSTVMGSSRNRAMAGPSAVRSIRAHRSCACGSLSTSAMLSPLLFWPAEGRPWIGVHQESRMRTALIAFWHIGSRARQSLPFGR